MHNFPQDYDFPHSSEFYPGQNLWGPIQYLEDAQWIQCTKEMRQKRKAKAPKVTKVTVEKVETDWVGVHWQCRAYSAKEGDCTDHAQPKFVVEGEDLKKLKLLNVFEPSTVQVGDRNFYVIKDTENVINREQWKRKQREFFQVPKSSPRRRLTKAKSKKPSELKEKLQAREAAKSKSESRKAAADSSDEWDTEDTESPSDSASVRNEIVKVIVQCLFAKWTYSGMDCVRQGIFQNRCRAAVPACARRRRRRRA